MSYLSLEDAAAKLGIPTDRLVELRSQGQVRGFRDGASWKFPENEIDRLADELGDSASGGSGVLASEGGGSGTGSHIIGGDSPASQEAGGSDLEVGGESQTGNDSDVDVVQSQGDDSDVAVVASGDKSGGAADKPGDAGMAEMDSADLTLEEPAVTHDSAELDLAGELKSDSTGPIKQQELDEAAANNQADRAEADQPAGDSGLTYDLEDDSADDELLGGDVLDEADPSEGSSLRLQPESEALGGPKKPAEKQPADAGPAQAADEDDLDLMLGGEEGAKKQEPAESGSGSDAAHALSDDDDLVIADDDDDLVISGGGSDIGSDISVAGDSGINLMSPSDSGLSLESEPLDLAGSNISSVDLGAELGEGGSGGGSGIDQAEGSGVDFQSDEEFQLSPSGVGLEADEDSGSQVIEVEDSEAIAEPVDFGDADFGDEAVEGDVFADTEEAVSLDEEDEFGAETGAAVGRGVPTGGYEIPFSMLQVVSLAGIVVILGLGGMLMTDLLRNMWTYSEPAAPVSSLTNSLVSLAGWD